MVESCLAPSFVIVRVVTRQAVAAIVVVGVILLAVLVVVLALLVPAPGPAGGLVGVAGAKGE